jgi:hypothetical protein
MFERARFVHVIRDGRAVANSLLNVYFWWGWRGPENWRWGPLPDQFREEWEQSERSFVVLAAIQWKMHMAAVELSKGQIEASEFFELRYEDLCENPRETIATVLEFAGIEWNPVFEREFLRFNLKNTNEKWKTDLNSVQQRLLEKSLAESLNRYGY